MTASTPTPSPAKPTTKPATNGTSKKRSSPSPSPSDDEDGLSSVADSTPPAKRKKIEKSRKETDEEYAKRLQAELNRVTGRSTRGGGAGAKRKAVVKTKAKRKSKARVGSEDDSDVEGGEKKEVKRTGGFHVSITSHPLYTFPQAFEGRD